MKRNSTVAAWTCLMLLLMASPAAAQSINGENAVSDKAKGQAAVSVAATKVGQSNAKQQDSETDKQLVQIQAQMKELRTEMKQLHEKKIQLLAKKHGIPTEGKSSKQIRQELREKLGIKGRLFHEKHHNNGKPVEDRQTQLQHEEEKHKAAADADGLTPEEIKAKFQELNGSAK
ncbi:serine protease [Paenibacillus alvei]|uniref:serine protease n=1 Tax=Paenibacillus alvei TaxID=44250 RepID=UPI0013DC0479|nr:serine protease [Paenibacillus alvei]NEZ43619.1 serine protease [Paenibacillus alvei]